MKFRRALQKAGDGRSKHVRDLRSRYAQLVADLGGEEELSAIERERVERLAHVEHWISRIEQMCREKDVPVPPLDKYLPLLYASVRLGDSLGVKRRTKRVMGLAEYMQARSSKPEDPAP